MTELEQIRAKALDQSMPKLAPERQPDGFVFGLVASASVDPLRILTPRQKDYLLKLCWVHREALRGNNFGHVVPAQNPYEMPNAVDTRSDAPRSGQGALL